MPEESLWNHIKGWWDRNASHRVIAAIPKDRTDGEYDDAALQPYASYFRLWLSSMFLTKTVSWGKERLPAVHSEVRLKFGDRDAVSISRVAQPPGDGIEAVALNYLLLDLVPYSGGTVEIEAALLALPGDDNVAAAIGVLQQFSSLLVPPISQVLTVTEKVASGIRDVFGAGDGSIHLALHETLVSSGDGRKAIMRPGYLAVVLARPDEVEPEHLSVRGDVLHHPDEHGRVRPLERFDHMLFRIEGRAERDDWRLSAIEQPLRQAISAMSQGNLAEAAAYRTVALASAWQSPDLAPHDRRRVVAAIKEELAAIEAGGLGAVGDEIRGLGGVMRARAMPRRRAAAEGPLTAAEVFGDALVSPHEVGYSEEGSELVEADDDYGEGARKERRILVTVRDMTDPVAGRELQRAFGAEAPHEVEVSIGVPRVGVMSAAGQPIEEVLPDRTTTHTLTVVFAAPSVGAFQSNSIELPSEGDSTSCTFSFTAGKGPDRLEAQILVLHENRVLQTALLGGWVLQDPAQAPPGFGLDLRAAILRPGMTGLQDRQRFEAALMVAHSSANAPVAAGISGGNIARFDDRGLQRATRRLIEILTDLADNPDQYGASIQDQGAVDLLRALAFQGVELYAALGKPLEEQLAGEDLRQLQVISTDPNDFIPIEFVYDLPVPESNASLCSNWKQALYDSECPPENHPVNHKKHANVVCPLGFWALKKVIERQIVTAEEESEIGGKDFAIRAEPSAKRASLPRLSSALFAASDKVDSEKRGQRSAVLKALKEATGGNATRVKTWDAWAKKVTTKNPNLLLLLSHTAEEQHQMALEIEADQRCIAAQITDAFVKASPEGAPVVLLLGCDTAVADLDVQTFVARFRDNGAAVVVGTIAPVLGEHAASVARDVVAALAGAGHANGQAGLEEAGVAGGGQRRVERFGELMLRTRCQLLSKGELLALCLASYGDADWLVGGEGD